jgi:F-type H+-transporting ATPase subunit delta
MTESTHYSQAALSYAKALLELAEEQKLSLESIGQEMSSLHEVIDGDDSFRLFLADPSVSHERRWNTLKGVLEPRVSKVILHLLGVMNDKGRLGLLREVADAYGDLLDQKLGKVEVDVTVAAKLSPEQAEEVRQRVSTALVRQAVIHLYVDESIIGGMVLRVGDQLIDASVRNQLQSLKERLLSAKR